MKLAEGEMEVGNDGENGGIEEGEDFWRKNYSLISCDITIGVYIQILIYE